MADGQAATKCTDVNLTVLCCGGTIDKGYDVETSAFVFKEGAVKEVFDSVELSFQAEYRTGAQSHPFSPAPSNDRCDLGTDS